jgi:hypothetical protein
MPANGLPVLKIGFWAGEAGEQIDSRDSIYSRVATAQMKLAPDAQNECLRRIMDRGG